jgi:anti-sigma-K factor RskA
LAAYLLGALEPDEVAELERHVEGCVECRAELRWLRPAVSILPESVDPLDPPAGLRERILTEARSDLPPAAASERRPLFARRWSRPAGWRLAAGLAAAVLLVAVVGGYALRGGSGEPGGTTTVATGKPPGVTAKMVQRGDTATLRLANVRSLPEDRVLEAWVQRDGEVAPVRGLFVPDREGNATTTIPDMRGVEAVMVTAEPQGGSTAPTSKPMVRIAVPQ